MTVPDMMMDFRAGQGHLVGKAASRAKVSSKELIGCHFSPNCKPRSIIQRLEAAQGRGEGWHVGKEEEEEEIEAIDEVVEGIMRQREEAPRWSFTLEQPRGSSLAQHPKMASLGQPVEVRMCCYGYAWSKPTWVWTNLFPRWWQPRPFDTCQYCRGGVRHPHRIVRRDASDDRPPPRLEGFTTEAAKNRIAPDLGEELAVAMIRRWQAE